MAKNGNIFVTYKKVFRKTQIFTIFALGKENVYNNKVYSTCKR